MPRASIPPNKPNGKKKPNAITKWAKANKKIVLKRPKPLTAKQKADRKKMLDRRRKKMKRWFGR